MRDWARFVAEIWSFRLYIGQMVFHALNSRYRRTALGILWTIIAPTATMFVTAFVFSLIMRFELRDFVIFVFSGMIPWSLFVANITQGGLSIINNEAMIKKIYVPLQVYPFSSMVSQLVDNILNMAALFIISLALGTHLSLALLFLPLAYLILLVFTFGVALISSVCYVYFRDLHNIVPILVQTLFYLTPIIYPLSFIPENFQPLFNANPMLYFIDLFRSPIYASQLPSGHTVAIAALIAAGTMVIAIALFRGAQRRLVYLL